MAKKTININQPQDFINIGSAPNSKDGDSLRAAFARLNEAIDNIDSNFSELYTVSGLNLGAFEFSGSTLRTTDSSAITIDQATTVTSNLTVGGDLLPSVANGGDLGSLARPWRSLYVTNSTIYLGGTPLSLDPNTNELKINNVPVSQTINYEDIPNVPIDVSDLTDTEGLLGGGGGNPFNQDLNTDDSVTFDSVGATTVNVSQINGTNPGDELVIQANNHNWNFGTDGSLTLPGTLDYRIGESFGGGSLAITSEGTVSIFTNAIEGFKLWSFDTDGNLQLPVGGEIRFSYGYIDQDDDVQGNALRISGGNSVVIKTDEDDKTWEFDNRGVLRLPADGDIIDSSGQSVLGGGSYTPDEPPNWNSPTVNTVQAALDELAARMTAFENFEIDGGNAYTPAAGELLIDGNGA
jgi:hypothetical protein